MSGTSPRLLEAVLKFGQVSWCRCLKGVFVLRIVFAGLSPPGDCNALSNLRITAVLEQAPGPSTDWLSEKVHQLS